MQEGLDIFNMASWLENDLTFLVHLSHSILVTSVASQSQICHEMNPNVNPLPSWFAYVVSQTSL